MIPDFFLVGAPRSGTTALCNYLRTHPDVFISSPKEPTYFGRDLVPKRYPTLETYLELFKNTGAARRAGDGSVAYLASDTAAAEIRAFNAQASIIIMLRDPVELIHSLHLKHYLMGIEPCRALEDALAAEPERLATGAGVPDGVSPKVIALRLRASYVPQIKRFQAAFPATQIRMFCFDDFRANPARIFQETCRFLGVREDMLPACGPHNVGRQVKNRGLHEFLTRSPRWAQTLARTLLPSPAARTRLQKWLMCRNQTASRPEPIKPELAARLREEFIPEITELEAMTGWNLSHWKQPARASAPAR